MDLLVLARRGIYYSMLIRLSCSTETRRSQTNPTTVEPAHSFRFKLFLLLLNFFDFITMESRLYRLRFYTVLFGSFWRNQKLSHIDQFGVAYLDMSGSAHINMEMDSLAQTLENVKIEDLAQT